MAQPSYCCKPVGCDWRGHRSLLWVFAWQLALRLGWAPIEAHLVCKECLQTEVFDWSVSCCVWYPSVHIKIVQSMRWCVFYTCVVYSMCLSVLLYVYTFIQLHSNYLWVVLYNNYRTAKKDRKSRIDFTSDLPSTSRNRLSTVLYQNVDSLYQNVGGKSIVDFTNDSTRFFLLCRLWIPAVLC